MKVINEITPLEINGKDATGVGETRRLIVSSHWHLTDRIHLKFENLDLCVSVEDLRNAINNAKNHS